jgi:hypothetical protein
MLPTHPRLPILKPESLRYKKLAGQHFEDWLCLRHFCPMTVCELTELGILIEVPRQFRKYCHARTIDFAASFVVLLVQDRQGEQYAVKVVKRESLVESNLEYFEREVRLLQFIRHPNIVTLSEVIYDKDNIILIMEYCEHGDLPVAASTENYSPCSGTLVRKAPCRFFAFGRSSSNF